MDSAVARIVEAEGGLDGRLLRRMEIHCGYKGRGLLALESH